MVLLVDVAVEDGDVLVGHQQRDDVGAQAAPRAKVIKVSAKRFDYSPGHLRLKKGQRVVLELTSRDVVMGFNLPDFNVRGDMIPGKVTRVEFTPDRTGEFTFLCDIF